MFVCDLPLIALFLAFTLLLRIYTKPSASSRYSSDRTTQTETKTFSLPEPTSNSQHRSKSI